MAKQGEATLLLRIKKQGEEALSATGDALKKLGSVAAAAYATAAAAGAIAIHAYKEQEEATNALNQALINQGIYSKSLSEGYQKIAGDLQKVTTFGDDAILKAQTMIQQYIGQNKVTKELTKATLDFATAMGMDLSSAANIVGKSIGTSTNMLGRYGIAVDENGPKSDKLAQVTAQLERRFGGQAEAAAQGLGSLEVMSNAMGEVMEAAGQKLAPAVIYAAKAITRFSEELQTNQELISYFETGAILLGKSGVVLKNVIVGLGVALGQFLGTVSVALAKAAEMDWKMSLAILKDGFSGTADDITKRYDTMNAELDKIDQIFANQKKIEKAEEIRSIQANEKEKQAIQGDSNLTFEQMFAARDAQAIQREIDQQTLKKDLHLKHYNDIMYGDSTYTEKLNAELAKRQYLEDKYDDIERKRLFDLTNFKENMNTKAGREFGNLLDNMAAMQRSKSAILVGIGKAAAIAQIVISGSEATMDAFKWFNKTLGPYVAYPAATFVAAYQAERIGAVLGVGLAEGGIVKATPGGVPAIIGEGGRDEMVIPLEKGMGGAAGLGTNIILQVQGGFLGSESQAKEFATALDRELFKLRKSNESLAFDTGLI